MPFITQGKTNWKFILILVVLVIMVSGGILFYPKFYPIRESKKLAVIPNDCILEPISCEGDINCIAKEIINQGKNCYLRSYTFSSDGNRVAYILVENPRIEEIVDENVRFVENYKLDFYVIVDGEKSQAYDYISYLGFSPDSQNFFIQQGKTTSHS